MRYFFDVSDSAGQVQDTEGAIFGTFDAMRRHAKRSLAEIAAEEPYPTDALTLSLRVRDAEGHVVYDICLSIKGQLPAQ